jgi:hypothetical protein
MTDAVTSEQRDELLTPPASNWRSAHGARRGDGMNGFWSFRRVPRPLAGLAVAVWWLDDLDSAIAARERAYALRRERGQTL